MPRASRSWKVHDDYVEIVKKKAAQKYGRQEDFAEQTSVSRSTVSKYLNGRLVDIAQFKELSFFLGFNDGIELACLPDGTPLLELTPLDRKHESPVQQSELNSDALSSRMPISSYLDGELAKATIAFYGRTDEVALLHQWILNDRCRVVALLGMGGIGKTTLAQIVVKQIQEQFKIVIWRSLRQSPPLTEVLTTILQSIHSDTGGSFPETTIGKIAGLAESLRTVRCLIVLDNMESIFVDGEISLGGSQQAGSYRPGYEDYSELIRQIAESPHQSCLLLTSREKPKDVSVLEAHIPFVRSLALDGLDSLSAQHILHVKDLTGATAELDQLIQIYAGNPLALNIVANTIQELFAGNITEFLAAGTTFFGHIGELLDEQFNRLSALEQNIMFWLALHQEPISLVELNEDIITFTSRRELLEALESLGRRLLIETDHNLFTQQSVVMEYAIERLIETVCKDIVTLKPTLLESHALIQARAKDYIRESQVRLILGPILTQLKRMFEKSEKS
jgi:transcriptional regulator with XRE-family HTH domain